MSLVKPLAYLSVPYLFLRSIANISPVARYYVRAAAYAGALMTVASSSFFVAIGYAAFGNPYNLNHFVARSFYAVVTKFFNIHVEVEGEEYLEQKPAILMANHQSMLDIIICGRLMPKQAVIVSKDSLKYTPLGPFMMLSGSVFINRGNSAAAVKRLDEAGNLIKHNKVSTWIFPEGTRHLSPKSDMLPLKKGGFHLAIGAGIPIIPIVVENYYHIYHSGFFGEGTIKVKVLPPIPTVGLTRKDVGDLAVRVREQMVETLHKISSHAVNPESEKTPSVAVPAQKPAIVKSESGSPATPSVAPSSPASLHISASTASIASSASSLRSRSKNSENGADTEEDEGMVLVGRPDN